MITVLSEDNAQQKYILHEVSHEDCCDADNPEVLTRIRNVLIDESIIAVYPNKEILVIVSPDSQVEVFSFSELPYADRDFWSNPELVKETFRNFQEYEAGNYIEVDEKYWDDAD